VARGDPGEQGYTPQVQPEDLPRKLNPVMRGPGPVGNAIEQLGEAVGQKYQADSATWAGDQLGKLRVQAVQSLENMKAALPAGEDPGNFTEKYLAQFDKQAAPLVDSASANPYARKMVEKGLGELRDTLATHTLGWEAAQRVAYRNDSIVKNLNAQLPLVEAHPEMADQVGSTLIDQINANGADPSARLQMARTMHEQLSLAAANGLARQDPKAVLDALNDPEHAPAALRDLNDQQREAVRNQASKHFVDQHVQTIQSVYENAGTSAGVKVLAQIDKDDTIPPELRDPIRDKLNQQLNAWRDQRREQFAPQIGQLETNIASENAGAQDKASAWDLYEKGALNTTQLSSALSGIERAEREGAKRGLSLEAARQAYEAGAPLDPQKADVKKGVGQLFSALTDNVPPGSSEYVNRATDVTAKVGVAPDPAISWARSSLVGGDAKSAAQAADLISRLDTANPRAVPYALDGKTKAIANTINEAVSSGTDPQTAVDMARKNAALGDADVKTLNERWKSAKADAGQASALQGRLSDDPRFKPGLFTSVPQVPLAMQSEFDALTKDYYRYTGGDVKQARDLAAQDLAHTWGVSEVNGKREIMAYAPEAMFPGLTPAEIRDDIANTVKSEKALEGTDAQKVQLVMDPRRTARTRGSEWNLSAPDEHGLMTVLKDSKGNPLVYRLPVTKEDFGAVRERQNEAAIEKARQQQSENKVEGEREAAARAGNVSPF
jgi:hypothetical protein